MYTKVDYKRHLVIVSETFSSQIDKRSTLHIWSFLHHSNIYIYKYKNEVGCRDDTVPKTGDTRRHCEVELTVCNNLPQPPRKRDVGRGVAEDCCILLTLPRSAFLCHLFLARCHPYILLHFYTCLTNFFCTAQGHVPIIHEHACPRLRCNFRKDIVCIHLM